MNGDLIHRQLPCMVEPLAREPISGQADFESAREFLEQESGVPVHIAGAEGSGHIRALTALPSRPAIVIE